MKSRLHYRFGFLYCRLLLQSIFWGYKIIKFWQFSIFYTSSCKPLLHWAARHSTLYVDGYTLYFYMVFMFYSLPPMYSAACMCIYCWSCVLKVIWKYRAITKGGVMYQTNSHTNNVNFQIIGKFFVLCMPSLFLEASIEYFLDKIDEFFVLT